MGGGIFGLVFLIFLIVRHFGACIKDNYHNHYLKNDAINKGYDTWMDATGHQRDIINNHRIITYNNSKYGIQKKDMETNQIYYAEIEKVLEKFHQDKLKPHKENMWEGIIAGKPVYIDFNSEEIYQIVYIDDFSSGKMPCHFYTDFWTNTQVIKKTDNQLKKEEKNKNAKIFSIQELINYPCGNYYRNEKGQWRITNNWKDLATI